MGDETTSGAGICSVKIGDREFTCLRVICAEDSAKETDAPFNESYITQAGRTVLIRSFSIVTKISLWTERHSSASITKPVSSGTMF